MQLGPLTRWLGAQLPSQCWICRRWPAAGLCSDCLLRWGQQRPRCRRCALPLASPQVDVCGQCLRHPPQLNLCMATVDYAYPWRDLMADFKFQGNTALARHFAQLMLQRPEARELLQQCHCLLPVPLSNTRLRQRGFDQTRLLAQALAQSVPPQRLLSAVIERRHTEQAQHELGRQQRLRQLQSVFQMHPNVNQWASHVRGRHVLLLDDVMTTGATLNALASTLRTAGAAQVSALVFARTPPP